MVLLKEKTVEQVAKKASPPKQDSVVQAQPGQDKYPKSDKANALNSSTEREEKQPEGCEKDPKSMEESEEKPPEGCNKHPKPVTPKPGAARDSPAMACQPKDKGGR